MGAKSPKELLHQWKIEQLSQEMAIGQSLQVLVKHDERFAELVREQIRFGSAMNAVNISRANMREEIDGMKRTIKQLITTQAKLRADLERLTAQDSAGDAKSAVKNKG